MCPQRTSQSPMKKTLSIVSKIICKRAKISYCTWGVFFLFLWNNVCSLCGRTMGTSTGNFNNLGNHAWEAYFGTIKIPSALSSTIFWRHLLIMQNGGKHENLVFPNPERMNLWSPPPGLAAMTHNWGAGCLIWMQKVDLGFPHPVTQLFEYSRV